MTTEAASKPLHLETPNYTFPDRSLSVTTAPPRPRASTVQLSVNFDNATGNLSSGITDNSVKTPADIFDSLVEHDEAVASSLTNTISPTIEHFDTLEALPIEIRSLTERFLKSLFAKAHPAPLSIEGIADLYQEFYVQVETHIATHIAAQATLVSRQRTENTSPAKSGNGNPSSRNGGGEQMLTAAEIKDRRRVRRNLDLQKESLDEAVERACTERLYDRIFRHRTGDDEDRDAKLRSKTAALNLIGIGLKELHVNVKASRLTDDANAADEINARLAPARECLRKMDDEHYPLGKLLHIKSAHKEIVDTLAHLFPASSSADEVLPTMIYTLITSRPDTLNVISNLHFVQLFRAASRIDGETAYCLVNLEAAIAFLENVDLSSLDTDRSPSEPTKPSDSQTLHTGADLLISSSEAVTPIPVVDIIGDDPLQDLNEPPRVPPKSGSSAQGHQRRLSTLLQNQRERLGVGRENLISTADQALESINTTLDNSLKFFFGRLQEHQSPGLSSPVSMPKTLDEARQLVSTSPARSTESDKELAEHVDEAPAKADAKLVEMIGGRRATRDRSTDSRSSSGSANKHVAFSQSTPGAAESVGSFVTSLNPLSRFGVASFPRFGRSTSGPTPQTPPIGSIGGSVNATPSKGGDDKVVPSDDMLARLRSAKPIQKYVDARSADELTIGDVSGLLADYQRLAALLSAIAKS